MANIKFQRGSLDDFSTIQDGQIIFDTDKRALYLDNGSTADDRLAIGLSTNDLYETLSECLTNPVVDKAPSAKAISQLNNKKHIYFGTCASSASEANKVVTVDDETFTLLSGTRIFVTFTNTNTVAGLVTLNVNGTGAKGIYLQNFGTESQSDPWAKGLANAQFSFVYDGTYWVREFDSYSNSMNGFGYSVCSTATGTNAKTVSDPYYRKIQNAYYTVTFSYAVNAGATLNINSWGAHPILYRRNNVATGIILAGDTVTFMFDGTNYNIVSIDRWGTEIENIKAQLVPMTQAQYNATTKTNRLYFVY